MTAGILTLSKHDSGANPASYLSLLVNNHVAHLWVQDPLPNIFFLLIDILNRLYNVIASDTCVVFNMHV